MANNFDKTNVGFKSPMLRSDLCEAYVLVEGRISVTDTIVTEGIKSYTLEIML